MRVPSPAASTKADSGRSVMRTFYRTWIRIGDTLERAAEGRRPGCRRVRSAAPDLPARAHAAPREPAGLDGHERRAVEGRHGGQTAGVTGDPHPVELDRGPLIERLVDRREVECDRRGARTHDPDHG